ncbi:pentapeptide repeat-containing protein [Chamaesiphon minutus]|nr:pentapeptide repeat-containing protein [Chamaesiphon minutus]
MTAEDFLTHCKIPEKGYTKVDFRGVDLSSMDLSGSDIRGVINLSGANLRGANLTGVKWKGVDLRGADLSDAVLKDASMEDINLSGNSIPADCEGVEFVTCYMYGCGFINLNNAVFRNCWLLGADFEHASIQNTKFIDTHLNGASFRADMQYIEFTRCDLSGSYIGESRFDNIRVEESHLKGVNFDGGVFNICEFIRSDLRGMIFNERILTKERVSQASIAGSMEQTIFEDTILSDVQHLVSYGERKRNRGKIE